MLKKIYSSKFMKSFVGMMVMTSILVVNFSVLKAETQTPKPTALVVENNEPTPESTNIPKVDKKQNDVVNDIITDSGIVNNNLKKNFDKKIICEATIKDDFVDNRIVVAFNRDSSVRNQKISQSEFENISVKQIEDLTSFDGDKKAKEWIEKETNENNFCQLLRITLEKNDKQYVLDCIKKIEQRDDIWFACPDYLIENDYSFVPNDPSYTHAGQYGLNNIHVEGAWGMTTGTRNVRVGVMDTGVNSKHQDLAANMVAGWNFVNNNSDTSDGDGHGTHVAGIIGAVGNNSVGISGVNWNVSIVPMKRSGTANPATDSATAITWAANNNVSIINMSFGMPDRDRYLPLLASLIAYPGLVVCAAGNETRNNDTTPFYPASFAREAGLTNMIVVASTDQNDNLSGFTNTGALSVDVAAPGSNIYSTYQNSYTTMSGTSMAAPQVAGIAALIKAKYPNLSSLQIREAILNSVDRPTGLNGKVRTNGRVNAYKALLYCQKYNASIPPDGVYRIRNVKSGLYLDSTGYGGHGYDIEQHYLHGDTNQTWQVKNTGNGVFTIRPICNPLGAVNVSNGSSAPNGANIILWNSPNDSDPASRFSINLAGTTTVNGRSEIKYNILSECSTFSRAITIQNGSTSAGGKCVSSTYNYSSDSNHWVFERYLDCVQEGDYFIKNINSNLYLDVPYASTSNGTRIEQHGFNFQENQHFRVTHVGDWVYTIRPKHYLSSAIQVQAGSTAENTQVQIWNYPDTNYTVRWKILPTVNGSYRVFSQCTDFTKLLAIQNDSLARGGIAIQKSPTTSKAESWAFVKY